MSLKQEPSLKESFDKVRALSGQTIAIPFITGGLGITAMNDLSTAGHPILAVAVGAAFLAASLGGCILLNNRTKKAINEAVATHSNTPKPE